MKIFFAVITGMLFLLMVGSEDPERHKHYAFAFLGAVAGTIAMIAIG